MALELNEVARFVKAQAPFSDLESSATEYFIKSLEAVYLIPENQNQWLNSNAPCLFLIRSGLYDILDSSGEVVARLSEGDYFGYPSLLTGEPISNRLEVQNEGIVYLLSQTHWDYLREHYKAFAQHFVRAHANRLLSVNYKKRSDDWSSKRISEIMKQGAVTAGPETKISDAAKTMSQFGVSSLMITENNKLVGVITDRDLRNRVLAEGRSPNDVVATIMTTKPKHVFEHNRVFSAFHLMLKQNIHHLPVLDESHQPLGMITATDLLRQQKSDPVQLIGRIYKAESVADIKRYALEVPELLRGFSDRVEDTSLIGKLLSGITDAMTTRLIQLFQTQNGTAPTPFSWICFGSQAREEQTLHSDQDNGLLLPDNLSQTELDYFKALGGFVCDNLIACGIKECPGGIMASRDACRMGLSAWLNQFGSWIKSPSPQAILNCKIFFDIRFVDGSESLFEEFSKGILATTKNQIFFASMATDINTNSVPIGLFNQFKLEKDKQKHTYIDLKKRGVAIINDIVRLYALHHNVTAANTLERLSALSKQQQVSKTDIYDLKDCWRYLTQLRLNVQLQQKGLPANCIDPEDLTSLERHQLKEAFYLIKQAQQAAAFKFARGSL